MSKKAYTQQLLLVGLFTIFTFIIGTTAHAQTAYLHCDDPIKDGDTVSFDIVIDTTEPIDLVRLEFTVDDVLSNANITSGDDFERPFFESFKDNMGVAFFHRDLLHTQSTGGEMSLARITFDWTGEDGSIYFNAGEEDTEYGSRSYSVGDDLPLNSRVCNVFDHEDDFYYYHYHDYDYNNSSEPLPPTLSVTTKQFTAKISHKGGFVIGIALLLSTTIIVWKLNMKRFGRVNLLLIMVILSIPMQRMATLGASSPLISVDICFDLQGKRTTDSSEPISYKLTHTDPNTVSTGNDVIIQNSLQIVDEYKGCFSTEPLSPGTYDLFINPEPETPDHLNRFVSSLTFTADGETIETNVTLLEGDANGDNEVSYADFSILVSILNGSEYFCIDSAPDNSYDDRADFNEDGCVSGKDASLLSSNLHPFAFLHLEGDIPEE